MHKRWIDGAPNIFNCDVVEDFDAAGAGVDGDMGGMVAVAATAGNAVAAALATLKVAPNELPLSPPRLWRLIQQVSDRRYVSRSTT